MSLIGSTCTVLPRRDTLVARTRTAIMPGGRTRSAGSLARVGTARCATWSDGHSRGTRSSAPRLAPSRAAPAVAASRSNGSIATSARTKFREALAAAAAGANGKSKSTASTCVRRTAWPHIHWLRV